MRTQRLSKVGYRFCMDQIVDLDFDAEALAELGFHFVKVEAKTLLPEERIGEDALSEHVIGLKHRLDSANIDLIVDKIETEQMLLELLDYNIDFDRVIFRRTAEKPGAIEHAADGGGNARECPGIPRPAQCRQPV